MEIKVIDSISECDCSEWDELASDNFTKYEYLLHVEKSMRENYKYNYILIYEKGKLFANACLFSSKIDICDLIEKNSFIYQMMRVLRKLNSGLGHLSVTIIGSPPSLGNSTINIADGYDIFQIVSEICHATEIIAKCNGSKLLAIKELDAQSEKEYAFNLKSLGYIKSISLPNNIFYNYWDNFDCYVSSLRTKYRQAIKSSRKKSTNLLFKKCYNIFEIYNTLMYTQYHEVLNKSNSVFETLTFEYFSNFNDVVSCSPYLIVCYEEDECIGYVLCAEVSDDDIAVMFSGINYDLRGQYDTYFNLIYEVMADTMLNNKKRLFFGQNSYPFKQRLGCKLTDLCLYYKSTSSFLNWFLKKMSINFFPKIQLDDKEVFRLEKINEKI